jgi:iron complex transport system substrate-binding protein
LITTSTTELPHVLALGYGPRLLGHDELDYIVAPELRQRIAAGQLVEVGDGAGLDLERILDVGPDLLLVDSPSRAGDAQLGRLAAAGIGGGAVPSFLEVSPLGRAEWIKLLAYFFDRDSQAEEIFSALAKRYEDLVTLAEGVDRRPRVLTSAPLGGTWYLPGGRSFFARLLRDAGGEYLWAEDARIGSLALDIESVMERGAEAEIWLHPSDWASLAVIRANDPRLVRIAAYANGAVFGNDARMGPAGGNDYWETGGARPDLVLADLIAILHPELLPDHRLYFHRRLRAEN